MAIRMLDIRNKRTGAKARLPESALPNLPDWTPTARQAKADAEAEASPRSPRKRTRKTAAKKAATRKAASAAQDKE